MEAFFAGLIGFLIGRGVSVAQAERVIEIIREEIKVEVKPELRFTFPYVPEEWSSYATTDLVHNKWVNVIGGATHEKYQIMGFMATVKNGNCQFALYSEDPSLPKKRPFQTWSLQCYYEMLGTGYYKPICVPKYESVAKEITLLVDLSKFTGSKFFEKNLYLQCLALPTFPAADLSEGCRKVVLWLKKTL